MFLGFFCHNLWLFDDLNSSNQIAGTNAKLWNTQGYCFNKVTAFRTLNWALNRLSTFQGKQTNWKLSQWLFPRRQLFEFSQWCTEKVDNQSIIRSHLQSSAIPIWHHKIYFKSHSLKAVTKCQWLVKLAQAKRRK